MKNILIAIQTEFMKMKRSWIFLITIGLFIFIPIMMALLMYIAQHPDMAEKLGMIGAKAQFFSENTWKGYLEIINQVIAVLGFIGFGFITSWVFGREYMEQTITDILALPVSRTSMVISKYSLVFIWCAILSVVLIGTATLIGHIINIPGWSISIFIHYVSVYFLTTLYTILLSSVIGLIASITRGITAPLGFVILMIIMAQFIALVGLGSYFPWAIPGVFTVSDGIEGMDLVPASYIILFTTSLLGFAGTIGWWKYADQK